MREKKEGQRTQGGFGVLWFMKEGAVRKKRKCKTEFEMLKRSLSGKMRVVGSKALSDVFGNWLLRDGLNGKDRVWFIWWSLLPTVTPGTW